MPGTLLDSGALAHGELKPCLVRRGRKTMSCPGGILACSEPTGIEEGLLALV